jgi:hypothetical protein
VKPDEDAIATILNESVPHDVMADLNTMFGEMADYHPRYPHWYLPTIGIEAYLHRKGLGSALLMEALRRCDHEHMPAYLESSNSANTALYQRFGFEARWASLVCAIRRPWSRCCATHGEPQSCWSIVALIGCSRR